MDGAGAQWESLVTIGQQRPGQSTVTSPAVVASRSCVFKSTKWLDGRFDV